MISSINCTWRSFQIKKEKLTELVWRRTCYFSWDKAKKILQVEVLACLTFPEEKVTFIVSYRRLETSFQLTKLCQCFYYVMLSNFSCDVTNFFALPYFVFRLVRSIIRLFPSMTSLIGFWLIKKLVSRYGRRWKS